MRSDFATHEDFTKGHSQYWEFDPNLETKLASGSIMSQCYPQSIEQVRSWACTAVVALDLAYAVTWATMSVIMIPFRMVSCSQTHETRRAGGRLLKISEQELIDVWFATAAICALTAEGHRVVVHCHAGYHRTGEVIYLTFRRKGITHDKALEAMKAMRPAMYDDFIKQYEKRPHGLVMKGATWTWT